MIFESYRNERKDNYVRNYGIYIRKNGTTELIENN